MGEYLLYDFPRSSASYRVRIALELKHIPYRVVPIDLRAGEQRSEQYLAICKAGLVPALQVPGGAVLTQSLAIMRYLDHIAGPRLFPETLLADAQVSAMALMIACDIHPLNNLRVLGYIQNELGASDDAKAAWYAHWVRAGLLALEREVTEQKGLYCYGDDVTAADLCLVPQMANARRFEVDVSDCVQLCAIDARLRALPAFAAAAPNA